MKSMTALILLVLGLHGANALAQAVYVTPGPNGPVYSDKPQPGAKEMTLKPLNVMPAQEIPAAVPAAPAIPVAPPGRDGGRAVAASAYRAFSVLQPEDNGSVAVNTGVFDIRLGVDPPLQIGEGHAFIVAINGRPVGLRFTATEFTIPPEFFGDTLPPTNQKMQLDVSIVDGQGQVIKRAAPVSFFMRLIGGMNTPRHRLPKSIHRPVTKPSSQTTSPSKPTAEADTPPPASAVLRGSAR